MPVLKNIITASLFVFVFSGHRGYAQTNSNHETGVYRNRLIKTLNISKRHFELVLQTPDDISRFESAVDKLAGFADNYPQSRFSQDALFMSKALLLVDASLAEDRQSAKEYAGDILYFTDSVPSKKPERLTVDMVSRVLGPGPWYGFTDIAYEDISLFLRGWSAWELGEYAEGIYAYLALKDRIDFSSDVRGFLAEEIYTSLIKVYFELGDFDIAHGLAEEAHERFPDNRSLRRFARQAMRKQPDN